MEILCLLQLSDCLFYTGDGKYINSVICLNNAKYYIDRYARLLVIGSPPSETRTVGSHPKIVVWLYRLCLHRQEFMSLVYGMVRLGPVLAMLQETGIKEYATDLSNEASQNLFQHGTNKHITVHNCDENVASGSTLNCHKGSSLDSSLAKLIAAAKEHYGRVALLLIRLPDLSSKSDNTAYVSLVPDTGTLIVFSMII